MKNEGERDVYCIREAANVRESIHPPSSHDASRLPSSLVRRTVSRALLKVRNRLCIKEEGRKRRYPAYNGSLAFNTTARPCRHHELFTHGVESSCPGGAGPSSFIPKSTLVIASDYVHMIRLRSYDGSVPIVENQKRTSSI